MAPEFFVFALPDELDFAQGAALILNYHTAYFSLLHARPAERGRDRPDPRRGGGVGTASIQVAQGARGAHDRARLDRGQGRGRARRPAPTRSCCSEEGWKDEVKELSGGGVDVVLDPVGGDRFTDSLRSLREDGRLVVVGFTGGSIPEVKVNRLLLGNTEVVGAGWGAYAMAKPDVTRRDRGGVAKMIDEGFIRPIIGERFPLERAGDALKTLDERRATGKIVLDVRGPRPGPAGSGFPHPAPGGQQRRSGGRAASTAAQAPENPMGDERRRTDGPRSNPPSEPDRSRPPHRTARRRRRSRSPSLRTSTGRSPG